ncbi:hypothetical protein [Pseudoalteromonas sp. PPB1]|uniref:hypothetical protein n=1 Tax=Pseudoalteromonas sp. PPB1 TaxID=2756136 RepID=UPI001891835E|nr:hypothetical protein [Pseudoalteromonas sp. PPB1]
MEGEVKIVAALIGVAGLVLAALMSSIGYLYRVRVESKRSARKVLYLLLEIRFSLNASLFNEKESTDAYLKYYLNRLNEQGVVITYEELAMQLRGIVESYFLNISKASKPDIAGRLLKHLEDALLELSQKSPVLAYRLTGKENLESIADVSSSYLNNTANEFADKIDEEWMKQVLLKFSQETEQDALKKISGQLDGDIELLSKHCGWFERRRCKNVLAIKYGNFSDETFAELDDKIEKLFEMVKVKVPAAD